MKESHKRRSIHDNCATVTELTNQPAKNAIESSEERRSSKLDQYTRSRQSSRRSVFAPELLNFVSHANNTANQLPPDGDVQFLRFVVSAFRVVHFVLRFVVAAVVVVDEAKHISLHAHIQRTIRTHREFVLFNQ